MEFTHFDEKGAARMVDVGEKEITEREAVAEGYIKMSPECLRTVITGGAPKGDVLAVARIGGITAAKRTSELIPLCHQVPLASISIDFETIPEESSVRCTCTAKTRFSTGVEMESLTGVSAALLTVYDKCKAVDKIMVVGGIRLLRKSGGRSGTYTLCSTGTEEI